ncbi:nucleotidyltransferase domain-containing protein [Synergistaceae bacterium OttesenSCG-928-D05]|nr:nucleotidyltransferase domain-containing protein [Synergistaceae bacterium OttesenSCG-928-D05]
MITQEQKRVFDELIKVLDDSRMLPHVMLIGSWAEYLYEHAQILTDYHSSFRTRDIDFFVMNLRKPPERTDFLERMASAGFVLESHRGSEIQRFERYDPDMEIEFLVQEKGAGNASGHFVKSLGITAEGLRNLEILQTAPLSLKYIGRHVSVPEPEAYILHKLVINKERTDAKREKDIESLRLLSDNILDSARLEKGLFVQVWNRLSKKQKNNATLAMQEYSFFRLLGIFEPDNT